MSFERASENAEKLAGPARARMGDMTRAERAQAEQVAQRDEIRGKRPGEHVQEDARDAKDTFTS
ncbi:general stress protein CsbD [Micromonospora sp. URMC 103]|uniref:general stress protein CsbD n=1 Tax=Micromonospora sp. URMC 103 TaxID=3423406 RepID=UPI003F1B9370